MATVSYAITTRTKVKTYLGISVSTYDDFIDELGQSFYNLGRDFEVLLTRIKHGWVSSEEVESYETRVDGIESHLKSLKKELK